jgi:hypothetical protein
MTSVYTARYQKLLERLLAARREARLTQVQVAAVFGKPQSFVSKCESGERRIDVVELGEFASLYRKPLTFFVGEGESPLGAGVIEDRPGRKPGVGTRSTSGRGSSTGSSASETSGAGTSRPTSGRRRAGAATPGRAPSKRRS